MYLKFVLLIGQVSDIFNSIFSRKLPSPLVLDFTLFSHLSNQTLSFLDIFKRNVYLGLSYDFGRKEFGIYISRQHASEVRVQQYLHQHSKKWVVCNAHVFHLSFSHRRRGKNESTGSCYTLHKWSQCVRIISEGEFLFFVFSFKRETYSVTFVKSNNLVKTF